MVTVDDDKMIFFMDAIQNLLDFSKPMRVAPCQPPLASMNAQR
jgi:hypothetical protein